MRCRTSLVGERGTNDWAFLTPNASAPMRANNLNRPTSYGPIRSHLGEMRRRFGSIHNFTVGSKKLSFLEFCKRNVTNKQNEINI